MAIYSTFFLCAPDQLHKGFPDWKLPLPEAVERRSIDPFTGEERMIRTRAPEWDELDLEDMATPEFEVVPMQGDYQVFLEERIPSFVKELSQWCSKNLTPVELEPLVVAATGEDKVKLETALYAHPTVGSAIVEFPGEFVTSLNKADDESSITLAKKWATIMSTPEYTHSISGQRINEDWTVKDALAILHPIIQLAKRHAEGQGMYLLIEF